MHACGSESVKGVGERKNDSEYNPLNPLSTTEKMLSILPPPKWVTSRVFTNSRVRRREEHLKILYMCKEHARTHARTHAHTQNIFCHLKIRVDKTGLTGLVGVSGFVLKYPGLSARGCWYITVIPLTRFESLTIISLV